MFRAHSFLANVLLCAAFRSSHRRVTMSASHYSTTHLAGSIPTKRQSIVALDFDGVVCASANESSTTGILAAGLLWPDHMPTEGMKEFDDITAALTLMRPCIESGYEIILLSRLLSDMHRASNGHENGTTNWNSSLMLDVMCLWNTSFRDSLLIKYNISKDELVSVFGSIRDRLIHNDPLKWANLNTFYPATKCALEKLQSSERFFIVTTKQERFVRHLLQHNNLSHLIKGTCNTNSRDSPTHADEQRSNIFDLHNKYGSKSNVLKELSRRISLTAHLPGPRGSSDIPTIHFVEDRYETLLNVLDQQKQIANSDNHTGELGSVRLYLADWGYNTPEQRAAARCNPGINVINQQQFADLMSEIFPTQ